jgi:hypothetical protein
MLAVIARFGDLIDAVRNGEARENEFREIKLVGQARVQLRGVAKIADLPARRRNFNCNEISTVNDK